MPRLVDEQPRGRLREEIDPAHLLLSAISLCWFPMVALAFTRDLGFRTAAADLALTLRWATRATALVSNGRRDVQCDASAAVGSASHAGYANKPPLAMIGG